MRLYIIRHAHAVDADEDRMRPLSSRGIAQIRALAEFLHRGAAFAPVEIWHSSLLRSRQTAESLKARMGLAAPLTLMPDLEPEDDPRAVARRVKASSHPIAIVGHEPHLSALASLLVTGHAEPPVFLMKKGSVLALEGGASHWAVRWHVSPDLLVART
jgi:phosphohistidine phosphatase